MTKSPDAFRTISEVAEWLDVPTHVLRFWESRFTQIKPVKRAGGRRYYRPSDMELLGGIKKLLHDDGLTIRGVQKILREEGPKHVAALSPAPDGSPEGRADTPMAVDVPSLPPKGEVIPFSNESRASEAGTEESSSKGKASAADPDDALKRWPFAENEAEAAAPSAPEATASPAPDDSAPSSDPDGDAQGAASEDKFLSGDATEASAPREDTQAPAQDDSAASTAPDDGAPPPPQDTGTDDAAPENLDPVPEPTPQALSDPAAEALIDTAPAIARSIAALPKGALSTKKNELTPLISRMEQLQQRLAKAAAARDG